MTKTIFRTANTFKISTPFFHIPLCGKIVESYFFVFGNIFNGDNLPFNQIKFGIGHTAMTDKIFWNIISAIKKLVVTYLYGFGRRIYLKGKLIYINKINSSPETIQISDNKFLDSRDYVPEDFISHSCVPNAKFDLVKRQVIAIKNISKNEEITFNYLTTEWDMKKWGTDFKCICGSKNCFGHINGFKYLSRAEKLKLKPLLSHLLLKKIS